MKRRMENRIEEKQKRTKEKMKQVLNHYAEKWKLQASVCRHSQSCSVPGTCPHCNPHNTKAAV
jgi:hypothetical protein